MISCDNKVNISYTSSNIPKKIVTTSPEQILSSGKALNEKSLLAGLAGLAVMGTYLVTKGQNKAPEVLYCMASKTQKIASSIPESVTKYLETYKPFATETGKSLQGEFIPKVTQIGSRYRAEFSHIDDKAGNQLRDIVIFSNNGKAVSRFFERNQQNSNISRWTYRLNDNGQQEFVQKSQKWFYDSAMDMNFKNATEKEIYIENLTVKEQPKVPYNEYLVLDTNSKPVSVKISKVYDNASGRLVTERKTYIGNLGTNWKDNMFYSSKYYAYGDDGKLVGTLTTNPHLLSDKDSLQNLEYSYSAIKDGKIVKSHDVWSEDAMNIIQGTPTEAERLTISDNELNSFKDYYNILK